MFIWTLKFDRKKAVFVIAMAALVLIGIIMLAGIDRDAVGNSAKPCDAATESGREEYLESLGWKIETPAVSEENVLIPKTFSEVFNKYNELQLSQGFDLSKYSGKELKLYTYKVTNHESTDTVLAELYVYKGDVVGGDIHSAALDGFMCGLKKE